MKNKYSFKLITFMFTILYTIFSCSFVYVEPMTMIDNEPRFVATVENKTRYINVDEIIERVKNLKYEEEKVEEAVKIEEEIEEPVVEEIVEKIEEPVVEEVEEVEIEEIIEEHVVEEVVTYFDVPLGEDLQDYIFELCEKYGVDPAIVIAMIERESNYKAGALGDRGNSHGLMQIQPRWNQARMNKLNCQNLLDPYQNVTVGVDLLGELFGKGKSVEWVLMAYNGGESYANRKVKAGEVSDYAKYVLARVETLVRG